MKFLKREPKKGLDELDLPPEPPPLEGFDENIPELPDFQDFNEKLSAPEMPKFDFSQKEPNYDEMPDFGKEGPEMPGLPAMEEEPMQGPEPAPQTAAPMPQPMPVQQPFPEQSPEPVSSDDFPRIERRLFSHEKRILREMPSGKTIYVRIDKFKATLGNINLVRSDLRKSEEALMKLENIKNSKDKSFDKVRASLDDLQKKLIFVDKTLFKGE
ncbi:hypothetical protein HYX08_05350 [Candidatus Woesearchaeota archaeon]|nr:hypothetical protein [Candidatus Woesearchaeota archaeon]